MYSLTTRHHTLLRSQSVRPTSAESPTQFFFLRQYISPGNEYRQRVFPLILITKNVARNRFHTVRL